MGSYEFRLRIARLLVGAMLFAQAALAAAGCDWLNRNPAQLIGEGSAEPSCHEEPARNANLCLAHCLGTDQSADTPQQVVPVWIDVPAFRLTLVERPVVRQAAMRHAPTRTHAPPVRILFHIFLI